MRSWNAATTAVKGEGPWFNDSGNREWFVYWGDGCLIWVLNGGGRNGDEPIRSEVCPWCEYDAPPRESQDERGRTLGWTCQRCGFHPTPEPS